MAIRSMTGYGRSERQAHDVGVEVEIRSVNARHLSVRCRLPSDWMRFEPRVEKLVRSNVGRGAVDVSIRIQFGTQSRLPKIDESVLAVYRQALDRMGGGDASALLRLPGVVTMSEPSVSVRSVERALMSTVREALLGLVETRAAEGERLTEVLRRELTSLGRHAAVIERRLPQALKRQQGALRRRLDALLKDSTLDRRDPTLMREVAVLAERSDVTEELDRVGSHMQALDKAIGSGGTIGRELDFLLQEIGREVNTLGAKAIDATISERVVRLKGCVERLREQVANIE
jgi:uncharacterized protein (TIGR00255 family)